jgi:alpha-amylase/alpha-mannosidase (GH57 family)
VNNFICIHGHFYQPPRENPWLEAIEVQDSAYPYHDWNARITAECYAPNGASRILDEKKRIARIVNNYAHISFNVGPTLLSWMEQRSPSAYQAILEGDRQSRLNFGGHGSAMAQAYNHMILPLANRRDKETQILWGLRDFERRFQRAPEGMWLPETAVDLESLDLMAGLGIRFVLLSPYQAARFRRSGEADWHDVGPGGIDPSTAYRQVLPSGRTITVFFYDGPVARAVAFERLLSRGEDFANRLLGGLSNDRTWPQLMHIATDGESYGHHHRHGDMALAYALSYVDHVKLARVTNYGEFLELHPPEHEVQVRENTSWSCGHGVERWRAACGCNSGGHPGWNQEWRGPLREALDWLRDRLAPIYEAKGAELFGDPWRARNEYIDVVLDRARENVEAFLRRHARGELTDAGRVQRLKLLEMQRHAMLMFTSCGWFFDEISGIETKQVIQYAARALQLAQEIDGEGIEAPFLDLMARAKSNLPEHGDGRRLYERSIRPTMLDLIRVGAHYAVSSLFDQQPETGRIYCYDIARDVHESGSSGRMRLSVGRARVTSGITWDSEVVSYAALLLSDQNVVGGVRPFRGSEPYQNVVTEITGAFGRADVPGVIRLFDRHFGASTFSLRSLFRDEQRRCLDLLLKDALDQAAADYGRIYERNAPVMQRLAEMGLPIPTALQVAAERALNDQLARAFEEELFDRDLIERLLKEAWERNINLDTATLGYALHKRVRRMADIYAESPADLAVLDRLENAVEVVHALPFEVDIWSVQNVYYHMMQTMLEERRGRAAAGDADARQWVERFVALGEKLRVRVD